MGQAANVDVLAPGVLVRSANGDNVFGSNQQGAQNAARLIETEIRVLEGNTVEDRVRQNLGITGDLPDVSGSAVGQTDVISVNVQSHDPQVAAQLAKLTQLASQLLVHSLQTTRSSKSRSSTTTERSS